LNTKDHTRFEALEKEIVQQHERNKIFDQRISGLEFKANRIDNNVAAILDKLNSFDTISTPNKLRKMSPTTTNYQDTMMDEEFHPDLTLNNHTMGGNSP
jgi:hypothetical protein